MKILFLASVLALLTGSALAQSAFAPRQIPSPRHTPANSDSTALQSRSNMVTYPTKEGTVDYHIPGINKHTYTWYKIVGTISASSKTPLVLLHGGPGASHDYLEPFTDLWKNYKIPVILYDQIGNGLSTHLREKDGDKKFWVESLFTRELDNLVDHLDLRHHGFDLYGQSWGGMLGSAYASQKPKGLRRAVLANSPASIPLWEKGIASLVKGMLQDVQDAFAEADKTLNYTSEAYQAAVSQFYAKHLCRLPQESWPEGLLKSLEYLGSDPTVYGTMQGPSEVTFTGTLKMWTAIERLKNIHIPVLIYNGEFDEAQNIGVEPFFWGLQKVKWVTISNASHMAHIEKREEVVKLVGEFLTGDQGKN